MTASVERQTAVFRADAAGVVNGHALYTDGVLIALETCPGTPTPTQPFDVMLVAPDGQDVLQGAGLQRSAAKTERRLIQLPKQKTSRVRSHPIVRVHERLQWKVTNIGPHAQLRVHLFVGADDGSIA